MTQFDLKYFEERLLDEQELLMGAADLITQSTKTVTLDQNSIGRLSRVDAMQSQAMAQAGAERQQQKLLAIGDALQRIDEGVFGRCIECDEFIATARLEIELSTEYCIKCAELQT